MVGNVVEVLGPAIAFSESLIGFEEEPMRILEKRSTIRIGMRVELVDDEGYDGVDFGSDSLDGIEDVAEGIERGKVDSSD